MNHILKSLNSNEEKEDDQEELLDELNKTCHIVEMDKGEKQVNISVEEQIIDEHPRFRPPLSEEHIKRMKIDSPSSSTTSTHDDETFFKIKKSQSIASPFAVFDVSEEVFNLKSKNEVIPGLDLINKTENSIKKEEKFVDMLKMNPCLGRKDNNFSFKNDISFRAVSTKDAIHAKYKCMGKYCSFFTSDRNLFLCHLKAHIQSQSSSEDFFLNCSYCFFQGKNSQSLLNHHDTVHKFCRFQCNMCFYRSSVQMSVYEHQKQFHSDLSRILECLDTPLLTEKDINQTRMVYKCQVKRERLDCCGNIFGS